MNGKQIACFGILVVFLGLLITRPVAPKTDAAAFADAQATVDPATHPMLAHLEQAHGVVMGSAADADIRVAARGDKVEIEFSESMVSRLRADALAVLELDRPHTTISETQYNTFLFMFHAFLTMAPAKEVDGRNYMDHED